MCQLPFTFNFVLMNVEACNNYVIGVCYTLRTSLLGITGGLQPSKLGVIITLNSSKINELIFDPGLREHDHVIFEDIIIEQVHSFKYLGVNMCNPLE